LASVADLKRRRELEPNPRRRSLRPQQRRVLSPNRPAFASPPLAPARAPSPPPTTDARRSDTYYQVKATIFGALIEAIDLAQLAKLDANPRARKSATSSTRSSRSRTS
jgi:hypothetical protein